MFITIQIKDTNGVSILQKSVNSAALPIISLSKNVTTFIKNSFSTYFANVNAQKRNIENEKEIAKLKAKLVEKENVEKELSEIKRLLTLTYMKKKDYITAEVLGNSSFSGLNLMLINKGSGQNIKKDMGVLSENGVVGRVWRVFNSQSQVQLISDNSSGTAVYLENANVGGVLSGVGNLVFGELKFIPNTIEVKEGEKVFTSGTDNVFARGILVGKVEKVTKTKGFFQEIKVKFTSNLSNLKYVFVLPKEKI